MPRLQARLNPGPGLRGTQGFSYPKRIGKYLFILLVVGGWGYAIDARGSRTTTGKSAVKSSPSGPSGGMSWSGPAFKRILSGATTGTDSVSGDTSSWLPPSAPAEGVSWSDDAYSRIFSQTATGTAPERKTVVSKSPPPLPLPVKSTATSIQAEKPPRIESAAVPVSPSKYIEAKPAEAGDKNTVLPPAVPVTPAEAPKAAVVLSRTASGVAGVKPGAGVPNIGGATGTVDSAMVKEQPGPDEKVAQPTARIIVIGKAETPVARKTIVAVPLPVRIEKAEWLVVTAGEAKPSGKKTSLLQEGAAERDNPSVQVGEIRPSEPGVLGDYERALEYYEKRQYSSAISILDGLLEKGRKDGNEDWRALELMGKCMNDTGKPVSALLYCRHSLEINPANAGLQALVNEMEGRVSSWSRFE